MKSFVITLLLLGAMLLGILVNSLYINNVVDRMLQMLNQLPDQNHDACAEKAREVLEYWNTQLGIVDLSINYLIVDRVTEQALLLVSSAEDGDFYGYRAALALLRDAVEDLGRLEAISMGSIL